MQHLSTAIALSLALLLLACGPDTGGPDIAPATGFAITAAPATTAARTGSPAATISAARASIVRGIVLTHGTRGSNLEPIDETASYLTTQHDFHGIVQFQGAPAGTRVHALWYTTGGGQAGTLIDDAYAAVAGTTNIDLTLHSRDDWVPGAYRLEVYVDDQLVKSIPFSVRTP